MKRKLWKIILLTVAIAATPCFAGRKKVLVYMMDGMRADMMETLNAPVWQELKAGTWATGYQAAWSVDASNEPYLPTNSAPNHTAIATGRLFEDHKVGDNNIFSHYDGQAAPTFLKVLHDRLKVSTAFVFSWDSDKYLIPDSPSRIMIYDDERNNAELLRLMGRDDAPDALLVFDDAPDHGAHMEGFYPYGKAYCKCAAESVARIGKLLDVIRMRPKFKKEDWLIVLCSDHGGYGKNHGMRGGQASTVPLLFCSKHMPAGRLAGRPCNLSITPTVLSHFGLEAEARKLPGYTTFTIAATPPADLSKGLRYALAVQNGCLVNTVEDGGTFTVHGTLPMADGAFQLGEGYVTLDSLKGFDGGNFAFAMTVELDPETIKEDPPLFSNKDWETGLNPGFCAFLKGKNFLVNVHRDAERPADFLAPNPARLDVGPFDFVAGQKTLLAVSVGRNGLVTFFQRHPDGNVYWFSVEMDGLDFRSELDWNIGQDGTGACGPKSVSKISDFRFWNRPLSLEELRSVEIR